MNSTQNTICGSHAIKLLLAIIELASTTTGKPSGIEYETKFVSYEQSEKVTSMNA